MLGTCPLPQSNYDRILLGHGSGGSLTAELIQNIFVPGFDNSVLSALEDQATLQLSTGTQRPRRPAHRLHHRFVCRSSALFPRRRYWNLAVHGTVNDLAVGGAKPLFLSAAFILEEGLPLADLQRIVASMRRPAMRRASRLSPATPKSSIAARAIRFSSPPPASASCPMADPFRSAMPGRAIR